MPDYPQYPPVATISTLPRCRRSCARGANFLLLFTLPLFRQRLSKGGRLKLLLVSQVGGELASAEAEEPLTAEGH